MPCLIPPDVYETVRALIEYAYRDEQKDWQECGRPKEHFFHDVHRVADWLDETNDDA